VRDRVFALAFALVAHAAVIQAQQPAPADTGVVPAAEVERPPELIARSCSEPLYPMMLRAARVEGRVLVQVVVDALGRVEPGSLEIVQSTHSQFNDPARRASLTCRFRPATAGGRLVRVRVHVPIAFRLDR